MMAFAGEYITKEIEIQSRYNTAQVKVSFVSNRRDSDKSDKISPDPFWLLTLMNIA